MSAFRESSVISQDENEYKDLPGKTATNMQHKVLVHVSFSCYTFNFVQDGGPKRPP